MILNGVFQYNNTTVGSLAIVNCSANYEIYGSSSYVCDKNGLWQGSGRCGKVCIIYGSCFVNNHNLKYLW